MSFLRRLCGDPWRRLHRALKKVRNTGRRRIKSPGVRSNNSQGRFAQHEKQPQSQFLIPVSRARGLPFSVQSDVRVRVIAAQPIHAPSMFRKQLQTPCKRKPKKVSSKTSRLTPLTPHQLDIVTALAHFAGHGSGMLQGQVKTRAVKSRCCDA